jgi:hypothetical protein
MIAVAVVAMLLAGGVTLHRRSVRFRTLAERHGSEAHVTQIWNGKGLVAGEGRILSLNGVLINRRLADWHLELRDKYRRASRHPWLPVAPDPPEPS